MSARESLIAVGPREECYRCDDGQSHNEAFCCHVCEEPICGYCADSGDGSEWFCRDCVADAPIDTSAGSSHV